MVATHPFFAATLALLLSVWPCVGARDVNPVSAEAVLFSDCCAPRHSPAIRLRRHDAHHSPATRLQHQHPLSLDCLPPLTMDVDSSERQTSRNTASSSPTNPSFFSALSRLSSATDTLIEWHAISAFCLVKVCGGKSCGREDFGRKRRRRCGITNHDASVSSSAFLHHLTRSFVALRRVHPVFLSLSFTRSVFIHESSESTLSVKTAAMKMLSNLIQHWLSQHQLALVKTNLIPQLVITLTPQSLSFSEAEDIHTSLMEIIAQSLRLASTLGLRELGIEDENQQQAVHETVLQQVLVPSEKYIWHLCVNRFSIIFRDMTNTFLVLLVNLLRICPSYQPTMDLVLNMPVFLTIPSFLTFFEYDRTIYYFLANMINAQWNWNDTRGDQRQMWKIIQRLLRMEGMDDVTEEKLRNDKKEFAGGFVVVYSIQWNNRQGMNLPELE
ncbi:hypothetical protein BLNAU_9944 [Blattamonas nauphoetae]|uniref:Uncharacterized protein n=1 Tax=Blattamonas nauphoetae TaxID=2049346 RepID=A0ABQ9XU56_9EUKA|nr:hypothetical protein BLNAU_9944 [Blattamonas nauphoetae]